jgi:hypothetical protein
MPGEIRVEVAESPRLPRNWHAPVRSAVLHVLGKLKIAEKLAQAGSPIFSVAIFRTGQEIARGDARVTDRRYHRSHDRSDVPSS